MARTYRTQSPPAKALPTRDGLWDRIIVGGAAFTFLATVAAAAIGYAGSIDQSQNARMVEHCKMAYAFVQDEQLHPALTPQEQRRLLDQQLQTVSRCSNLSL